MNVKKWLFALFAVLGLTFSLFVGVAGWAASEGRQRLESMRREALSDYEHFRPDLEDDLATWRDSPLFAPHDGGDAAPLLLAHLRWDADASGLKAGPVPPELVSMMKAWGADWPEHVDEAREAGFGDVDFAWMGELRQYSFWDWESPGGPLDKRTPIDLYADPMPSSADALDVSRARLLKGLVRGETAQAAAEVHELARLWLHTESLIGDMIGTALLGLEERAYRAALARREDVGAWRPVTEPERKALQRLLWASKAPRSLLATGALAEANLAPGDDCSALREGLLAAHFVRQLAEPLDPPHFARLDTALAKSNCRLRRVRLAIERHESQLPLDPSAMCHPYLGTDAPLCSAPRWLVHLPFVRTVLATQFVTTGATDWFKQYRAP